MPTYEYYCENCSSEFEDFQSITSKPYSKCPKCGKKTKRSISSGGGIMFKGDGFYINDYKKKDSLKTKDSKKD